jgi:hypothetical protein
MSEDACASVVEIKLLDDGAELSVLSTIATRFGCHRLGKQLNSLFHVQTMLAGVAQLLGVARFEERRDRRLTTARAAHVAAARVSLAGWEHTIRDCTEKADFELFAEGPDAAPLSGCIKLSSR